jgi:hypothetical protein
MGAREKQFPDSVRLARPKSMPGIAPWVVGPHEQVDESYEVRTCIPADAHNVLSKEEAQLAVRALLTLREHLPAGALLTDEGVAGKALLNRLFAFAEGTGTE